MTIKGTYPDSPTGRFQIKDTIGTPHPYCLGPKHVSVASKYHGGMLGESAIEDAENRGAHCMTPNCNLRYKEHEQALLVSCAVDPREAKDEVEAWLKSIVGEVEKNGYAGFCFVRAS